GNSVERHLVTRRLRAVAAAELPQAPRALDVVVRALPGAASCSFETLGAAVRAGLGRWSR
ncbi:MAG: ribonuclease P protein component, partial [Bifidobacteriaceae bacterium]|nr:ribonuclease P protein component [Bifidobacteriaceae bacterium]